jgi:hypothetical protein
LRTIQPVGNFLLCELRTLSRRQKQRLQVGLTFAVN